MQSLASLLAEEEPQEQPEAQEPVADAEMQPQEEPAAVEASGEEDVAPPATTANASSKHEEGLRATITATRKRAQQAEQKAQEYERRLNELEQMLRSQQQAQQQQQQPAFKWSEEKIWSDVEGSFNTLEARVLEAVKSSNNQLRYSMSEETARGVFSDYDEVMQGYTDAVREIPGLLQSVDASASPAVTAYRAVKKHLETRKATDPQEIEARIAAEVEKRVAAAMAQAQIQSVQSAVAGVPKPLASARGTGGNVKPQWSGPPSWSDILA